MEKVGFVGAAMAGNLLRTGHKLVVHNRTKTKSGLQNPLDGPWLSQGAGVVPMPQHSDRSIIMSMC